MSKICFRFKNIGEIKECAKYYIELLGLQDWRIVYKLTNDIEEGLAGLNESDYTSRTACISIRKDLPEDLWVEQPAEETLIHELLHCKFLNVEKVNRTIEGVYYEQYMHTLLDDMARAIFRAKYNLKNDWYELNFFKTPIKANGFDNCSNLEKLKYENDTAKSN